MNIITVLLLLICILILVFFQPTIDVIPVRNKYVIILWYYKHHSGGYMERTYIKLFEF